MFVLCLLRPFVEVFYATEQALFGYSRRPVLCFHLDHKDIVSDLINVAAPFEPDLFLGKSMYNISSHRC